MAIIYTEGTGEDVVVFEISNPNHLNSILVFQCEDEGETPEDFAVDATTVFGGGNIICMLDTSERMGLSIPLADYFSHFRLLRIGQDTMIIPQPLISSNF